jgi:hypothetical protein
MVVLRGMNCSTVGISIDGCVAGQEM